ncbi:unnamed protein product [Victoria cruziana]
MVASATRNSLRKGEAQMRDESELQQHRGERVKVIAPSINPHCTQPSSGANPNRVESTLDSKERSFSPLQLV